MFYCCVRQFRKSHYVVEGLITNSVTSSSPKTRNFTVTAMASSKSMKVAVLGAAGRTGTCLSLLLKQSSLIDELALYDNKAKVTALDLELNHIDTKCKVSSSESGEEGLGVTLEDAKIVVITAGQPCDMEKCPEDIVATNAHILLEYVPSVLTYCPTALLALTTSPINQMVPLVAEIYKKHGLFDLNRIFGITTLNCVRANTFASRIMGIDPECVMVPVIGGNCSETRVPIFSQMTPCSKFTDVEISKLTYDVRMAEDELAGEYNGKGSSSLGMGFAAARFCISLCKALRSQQGVIEYAFVRSCVIPEVSYFAGPLEIGPCGIQKYLGVPPLNDYECTLLAAAIPHLREEIRLGEALALGPRATSTEICSPDPDPCTQDISGNMLTTNKTPQTCST